MFRCMRIKDAFVTCCLDCYREKFPLQDCSSYDGTGLFLEMFISDLHDRRTLDGYLKLLYDLSVRAHS